MIIVINHLTRMKNGICVAGIDLDSGSHIRPVMQSKLEFSMLERYGGAFDIGNCVDLGPVVSQFTIPRYEDHLFQPGNVRTVGVCAEEDYWNLMQNASQNDLSKIFGPELVITPSQKAYLLPNTGAASLGCLIPTSPPELFKDWEKLRIRVNTLFCGRAVQLDLSPTDIRLYENDHQTPNFDNLDLNDRLKKEKVILSVGVGHPMPQTVHHPEAHWLQVNAIHLSGSPVRKFG